MGDHIRLNDMVFYGYHGVLPEERALGQRFVVSIDMGVDLAAAGRSDDLTKTVNYADVYALARDIVTGAPCQLIETVAERISAAVLTEHPGVQTIVVRIQKPAVPLAGAVLGSSEVCIERARA